MIAQLNVFELKNCNKCNKNKTIEDFNKGKTQCKECLKAYREQNREKLKEYRKAYYEQNREKVKECQKAYREQNREKLKECNKAYREQNREKVKEYKKAYYEQNREKVKECQKAYREQNREKLKECQKAYREQNREKVKEYKKAYREQNQEKLKECRKAYYEQNREKAKEYVKAYRKQNRIRLRIYYRNKIKTDINFKLAKNLRTRVVNALKGKSKSQNTLELLGCSVDFAKKHLENQFQPGMSWENYGFYGWHVDHIVPCASFDLIDPEQQKKCFHYSNLQPLWAKDNMSKQAKLNWQTPKK
jgi:hypothetical protein